MSGPSKERSNSIRLSLPRRRARASTTSGQRGRRDVRGKKTNQGALVEKSVKATETDTTDAGNQNPANESHQATVSKRTRKRKEKGTEVDIDQEIPIRTPSSRHRACIASDSQNVSDYPLILEGGGYKPARAIDNIRYKNLRGDKGEEYYCVGSILKARLSEGDRTIREFEIKWSGWSHRDNTWEPEPHLNGSVILLNKFCRINRIRSSLIDPVVGGSQDSSHNEKNWVSLKIVRRWIVKEARPTIPVKIYLGQPIEEDSLFLIPVDCHCYVMLFVKHLGISVVADGRNWYKESEGDHPVEDYLPTANAMVPRYKNQKGVDDCGASGVMIGIELLRRYRNKTNLDDWMNDIDINTSTHQRVLGDLRIGTTALINRGSGRVSIVDNRKWYRCKRCNWSTLQTDRRAISIHVRINCPEKDD